VAQIVAGFMMPHDPLIAAAPMAPPEEKRNNCMDGFARIAERIRELNVDTVVVIGDDHYTLHGPGCVPQCMIGIGDVEGPIEPWVGIERSVIENNTALAEHIMQVGFDSGVDWAVSKTLMLDHSGVIPIHYSVKPVGGVKSIPVYINSGIAPVISSRRAHQIGEVIGKAVESWGGDERVAILGTGGISHWVGMAEMGRVNEEWDHKIISCVEQGDVQSLIDISDAEIITEGGNGGLEIKNWICAMGAMGALKGELIAYEAVPEWVCGCGYMELTAA